MKNNELNNIKNGAVSKGGKRSAVNQPSKNIVPVKPVTPPKKGK